MNLLTVPNQMNEGSAQEQDMSLLKMPSSSSLFKVPGMMQKQVNSFMSNRSATSQFRASQYRQKRKSGSRNFS